MNTFLSGSAGTSRVEAGRSGLLTPVTVLTCLAALMLGGCLKHGDDVPAQARSARLPRYDHVVVVIEENHTDASIMDPASPAPYLRSLAKGGAYFSESYAVTHPSQPNYLALFAGSTHGVTSDAFPTGLPYSTPNLGAALLAKGLTFTAYSDAMPEPGYTGEAYSTEPGRNHYMRKHCPWTNWQSPTPGANQLPPSVNQPFEGAFPAGPNADFAMLPHVAFVIPDEQHDMHDGSVAAADAWLHENLGAYAEWARTHNSLLIVTWDEDDALTPVNRIPTFFYGAHIKPGRYGERITHYAVLRTIEDIFSVAPVGESAKVPPIVDVFE